MRVVHVNTWDRIGGAAAAAYRIHDSLRQIGVVSYLYVSDTHHPDAAEKNVIAFRQPPLHLLGRLERKWHKRIVYHQTPQDDIYKNTFFNGDRTTFGKHVADVMPDADIVNLHWTARFVDWPTFFTRLPKATKFVWTLHDMNPFTGGCHYSKSCTRYQHQCGRCPELKSDDAHDFSHQVWRRKQAVLKHLVGRLHVVATTSWMHQCASESNLFRPFPVSIIPYPIPETFHPYDKQTVRTELELPQDHTIILFVSNNLRTEHKGFSYLNTALSQLPRHAKLTLITVGKGSVTLNAPIQHRHLGYINDPQQLAKIFSSADMFVMPSLEEAFGQVAIEALACATPVIAFATGGLKDIVIPHKNGLLVEKGDANGLRDSIQTLIDNPEKRLEMGRWGCQHAVSRYSPATTAESYRQIYQSLLDERD